MNKIMHVLCKPLLSTPLATLLVVSLLATPAQAAGTYSWTGSGTNTNWSTTGNWATGTAPTASSNTLAFSGSTRTSNTNDISSLSLSRLNFLAGASAFTLSGSSITLSSGTISNASSNLQTINLGITLAGTNTISLAGAGRPLTLAGVLAGSGSITKTGVSVLTLSGSNNTYSGLTTVSAGTLAYGASDVIGSGGLTVSGGTVAMGNYSDTVGAVTVTSGALTGGSGTLTAASYTLGTGLVSASLAGSGTVSKTGNTLMTLTGSNSFTGDLVISAGTLNIQNSAALGSTSGSTTIAANSALQLQNNITLAGETIRFTTSNVNGSIRNVSGTNTISGSLGLTGGAGRINSEAGLLIINGASTLSSTNAALSIGGAGDTQISRVIALGNAGLTKDGAGTLTLSGSNTYSGQTAVSEGKLVYGTNNALGIGTVVVGSATTSAVLNLGAYSDSVGRFTLNSGSLAMVANSPSQAQLTSTGTILLGTTNTLDLAGTTWTSGIYKLLAGTAITGTFGTVDNLQNGYSLVYGGTSTLDLQQQAVLSTVTAIPASGSIITGGSLAIGYTVANSALSGGADLAFTGTAGSNLTGSTSGTAAAASTSGTVSGMAFTGATTGSNQVGTFTVSAPNAYGTTSTTSSVSVNVYDHASPTAGSLAGGTLALGGVHAGYASAVSTNSLTGSNAAGYRVDMSGSAAAANGISLTTLSGVTAGSSSAITATLAGGASLGAINENFTYTFADDSTLSGASANLGTAAILVTGSVYSGQSVWATNGSGSWGTLNNSFGTNWGANQGSPGLDAGFTNTDTATFSSALTSGTAVVSLNGAAPSLRAITFSNTSASYDIAQGSGGALTLSGSGGAATVDVLAGNQSISAPLTLGTAVDIDVAAGAQLTVNGTISGTSGSALNLTGLGTTIFSGTSDYTGNTNVNAGELLLSGALGNTAVSLGSGATLAGNGSILGDVTVQDGGTISPGSGPYDANGPASYATLAVGNLLLGGSNSTATTLMDIQGVNTGAGTAGINYDQIAAGNIEFGGDLVLNFWTTDSFAAWTVFHLFDFTGVATEHFASVSIGTGEVGNVYAGLSFSYKADGEWVADGGSSRPTLSFNEKTGDLTVALVPEPSTLLIAGIGVAMTFYQARRKAAARRRQRLQASVDSAGVSA